MTSVRSELWPIFSRVWHGLMHREHPYVNLQEACMLWRINSIAHPNIVSPACLPTKSFATRSLARALGAGMPLLGIAARSCLCLDIYPSSSAIVHANSNIRANVKQ